VLSDHKEDLGDPSCLLDERGPPTLDGDATMPAAMQRLSRYAPFNEPYTFVHPRSPRERLGCPVLLAVGEPGRHALSENVISSV